MDLIVAVDQNWAIGKDGEQLLYLSQDLKRFKALTLGHAVILGRRTLSTFPGGRPLKGRRNLILSTTPGFAPEGGEVYPSLDALLAAAPAQLSDLKNLEPLHLKRGPARHAPAPFCRLRSAIFRPLGSAAGARPWAGTGPAAPGPAGEQRTPAPRR